MLTRTKLSPRDGWPYLIWPAIALLALPALWPLYAQGLPTTGDGTLHLQRLMVLDYHVTQGVFYPRWAPEFFLGFGYPVFNFYGPTTFYLAELIHLLGVHSYVNAMIGAFSVIVLLAGYGMFLFARDFFADHAAARAQWPALTATVAYIYAPYFITNIYVRGAVAEAGAMALLPWVFWSFRRLLTRPQPVVYVVIAALSLGGLAATHNITLLFAPPALLLYIVVVWWQERRRGKADLACLGWVAAGGLAAMGVGAFFWLPLIGERHFLSDIAYAVSTTLVPRHVWIWDNFLNLSLPYFYSDAVPFQVGILQVGLAVVGFLLIRRRDAEWGYLGALAALGMLAISALALPIWLGSEILLIAQFPWRLLSVITLPLALFVGGLIVRIPRGTWQLAGAGGLIALLILAHHPPYHLPDITPADDIEIRLSTIAQFEADTGAFGASSSREFLPRWAEDFVMTPAPQPVSLGDQAGVEVIAANPLALRANVVAAAPFELRFTDYFFPGWQVTLDGDRHLAAYPTTVQGLLTVQVPSGEHLVEVAWVGTDLQRWAGYMTLLTLVLLLVLLWTVRRPMRGRWPLTLLLTTLLIFGSVAMFRPAPELSAAEVDSARSGRDDLQLAGLTADLAGSDALNIFPRWFVQSTPPDLLVHWQLQNQDGGVVSQATTFPYFGTLHSNHWPAGTLIDDAYEIALPPGLAAGDYRLTYRLVPVDEPDSATRFTFVREIALPSTPAERNLPERPTEIVFGDGQILLDGFSLAIDGRPVAEGEQPVVRPGEMVEYTLFWRGLKPVTKNYHGFVHLLDVDQQSLVQRDQLPGPVLNPPMLWNQFYARPDIYRLRIPDDATGGIYRPLAGLYHFDTRERLPVALPDGTPLGDGFDLGLLKIVGEVEATPQQEVGARFENLATLTGYDLEAPTEEIRAGDVLTLTLYYASDAPTDVDYTQFVHVYNAELGMASQTDSQPLGGGNPTSTWIPGEVIVDRIPLTVADDVQPGSYELRVGLYDGQADALRLPVYDGEGNPLPNAQVILTTIVVEP